MKIKGIEMKNYGIFVRSAVNMEEYMTRFFDGTNPVEIMLISENANGVKTGEYDIFCENRKVGAKVLKKVKEDLKEGFLDLEFENYNDFILNTVGDIVTIIVFDPMINHSKFYKIDNGCKLPF